MYLENIFVGSEDIRRQLPSESALFDTVDNGWRGAMETIAKDTNAKRATHADNMLHRMIEMNGKLEKIQKSLDQYLETKRQAFPRFYFLSNDDLLEILGQARDPTAVQPHLKKCFEAIKALKFEQNAKKLMEAHGMTSPELEFVGFQAPVLTDGAVEMWLTEIESAMRLTLRRLHLQCINAMRGSKKEKWVNDWAGQLLLSAGQVGWTLECEKSLGEVERGNKNTLRLLKKKWITLLNKYTDMIRSQLSKLDRLKVVAQITIEVHARDVIDKMIKVISMVSDSDFIGGLFQRRPLRLGFSASILLGS